VLHDQSDFPCYDRYRERFLALAQENGARVSSFPLSGYGFSEESSSEESSSADLFVDVARIGPADAPNCLLSLSGTHGIEGYAGSMIQQEILSDLPPLPANTQYLLIHGLDPYGMKYFRKANEHSVDLNRNFLFNPSEFCGAPKAYQLLDPFLNKPSLPNRLEAFTLRATLAILRHGYPSLKQAIAEGQYEYPRGIFFGGKEQQASLKILTKVLSELQPSLKMLVCLEIHTGLGAFGDFVLFSSLSANNKALKTFEEKTGLRASSTNPHESVGYVSKGDIQSAIPKLLPGVQELWFVQEFGTFSPLTVVKAIAQENRYHHCGGRDPKHWTKKKLLEAFYPKSNTWRARVREAGAKSFKACLCLFD
jgi:hypothetical protein